MRYTPQHCKSHDRCRLGTLRAMSVKTAALAAITQDSLVPLWRSLGNDLVVVLMAHRFADNELGNPGASAAALRTNLEVLRRHRFHLGSLRELLDARGTEMPSEGPTIVFTVDDGYADFARIAAPIFAEFDCPVTVFVVTDVIEGKRWFWWDRVGYVIESSRRERVVLELSTGRFVMPRAPRGEHEKTAKTIVEKFKRIPDAEKDQALVTLASQLEVEVPASPPPRYAPLTWSDVQRCAAQGVTFGAHTVSHPILTQTDPARAASEIRDSLQQLRDRCSTTLPVFSYPNGAYAPEHVDILATSGMRAAVTTEPGYATRAMFASADPTARFRIPRFAYAANRDSFVQTVAGLERLKMGVREAIWGPKKVDDLSGG
jgi:peptidoglycan/xylan/chitin deacetylase (PgdA/CDA1 family)